MSADNLFSVCRWGSEIKSLSAAEGQQIARMTTETLKTLRNDVAFHTFWQKVNSKAGELEISEPQLPRHRKLPRRLDDGLSAGDFHDTPKSHKQQYFEGLDLIVSCFDDRFDQPGYRIFHSLELLLTKACMEQDFTSELNTVCNFYGDDFDHDLCVLNSKHWEYTTTR